MATCHIFNQDFELILYFYQIIMKGAFRREQLIEIFQAQLKDKGIQIGHTQQFKELWYQIFFDNRLTAHTETIIKELVQHQHRKDFIQFIEAKVRDIQTGRLLLQDEIHDHQQIPMVDEAQPLARPKKRVDLRYQPEKYNKNVVVVVISQKKLKQLEILSGSNNIVPHQPFTYDEKEQDFFGYCAKIPANFDHLKLSSYSIRLTFQSNFFMMILKAEQKQFSDLDKRVQYSLSRGVIFLIETQKDASLFKKKLLLRMSQYLFGIEKEWNQVKPWWHLIRQVYPSIEDSANEAEILDEMLINKKQTICFLKYFIWLLKSIYQERFQEIKNRSEKLFPGVFSGEPYQRPPELTPEIDMIQNQYLLCFLRSNKEGKMKEILEWNLTYQSEEVQSQILLSLSRKLIQEKQKLVQQLQALRCETFASNYSQQIVLH